jgi:ABC-type cobalt transport system substrate-binding protein
LESDGQALHVVLAAAFTAVEYVPAPQSVHAAAPGDVLYFPATQSVHVPPSGPVEPALQVQLVEAALPASELESDGQVVHVELAAAFTVVEYVPAPQSVHAAAPVDVLYFPAAHAVHVPPSGPVEPVLQVQLVEAALPASELESDGQALHVVLAAAFTVVEYVPAPQSVHAAAPVDVLYFPATHAVHVPPSGPVEPVLQVQLV